MTDQIRIAVTGSRGKSGVVRLLQAACSSCGLRSWARLTGVLPREVGPDGERPILRPSGAHVEEMRWWLSTLPADAQAIILENSAVAPDLLPLCSLWLNAGVTVLTNARPDHESHWGPGEANVLRALSHALPEGGVVALPQELAERPLMADIAQRLHLKLLVSSGVPGLPPYLSANYGMVLSVCAHYGLDLNQCRRGMDAMRPDIADFTVLHLAEAELAFAFSANDLTTTQELFRSLNWCREETTLLYNHRGDRIDRFRSFANWLGENGWKDLKIIGDRPPRGPLARHWLEVNSIEELAHLSRGWGRQLGCGNAVYGLPLRMKLALEEGRLLL